MPNVSRHPDNVRSCLGKTKYLTIPRMVRVAARLLAPLFFFDRFLQYSSTILWVCCGKQSIQVSGFCRILAFLPGSYEENKNFLISVGRWYTARAPPFWKFETHYPIQIFGGNAMHKTGLRKISQRKFLTCPRGEHVTVYDYHQSSRKGVRT